MPSRTSLGFPIFDNAGVDSSVLVSDYLEAITGDSLDSFSNKANEEIEKRVILYSKTTAEWEASDIVLRSGEIGYDSTKGKIKFGDGTHTWNDLEYYGTDVQFTRNVEEGTHIGTITIDGVETKIYVPEPEAYTYTPSVTDGVISWTNDGGLPNPEPANVSPVWVGTTAPPDDSYTVWVNPSGIQDPLYAVFTPSVSSEGVLTWTNNGGLPNPPASNVMGPRGETGYYFTPAVASDGTLSWTNNGGLTNPDSVKLSGPQGDPGYYFTPSVAADGTLTWTNNGNLPNPTSRNLKGPRGDTGYYFTPSVSEDGILSWTNNGSLDNPASVDITGPKGDMGTAAGFGTPTISVTQLEEGATPTATVTATGSDTEKVFSFALGIPQGATGESGAVSAGAATDITGLIKGDGVEIAAAEAGTDYALPHQSQTVVLPLSGWNTTGYFPIQTVGMADVRTTSTVIISPIPDDAADYASSGILCTMLGYNAATFRAVNALPTRDLTVNVVTLR